MEKRTHQFLLYMHKAGGALSQMYFEFLLLHHAGPFENLGEAKIHQESWQVAAMSNVHSRSNSRGFF